VSDKLLKMSDVCALLAVKRWTIHYYVRECEFPKPIKIKGVRGNRWDAVAVAAWREAHPV